MTFLDPIILRTHDYGLIPPGAARDPAWQSVRTTALAPSRYAAQAHLFPRLIATSDLSADQRAGLCEAAEAWDQDTAFLGALLRAERPVKPHLTRALVISRPRSADRLLRFYDPRAYIHLRWMLTPDQQAALLGPATAWTWPDRDGHWQTDDPAQGAERERAGRYTPTQLAQFDRIEYIERGYRRLTDSHPDAVAPAHKTYEKLDRVLAEAMEEHGLRADRDLDLYVDHALTVHPHIQSHPAMQARLANVARGQSYRGACRRLDPETLARYARELDQRNTAHLSAGEN